MFKKEEKSATHAFKNMEVRDAHTVYDKIKCELKEHDGYVHVLMINSFSKWINQMFGPETKYTTQIDEILTCMQADGYEIVDIKFNNLQNQGIFANMEGFATLVMYK